MITIEILGQPLPWKAPYVGSHGAFSSRTVIGHEIKKMIRSQYSGEIMECDIDCEMIFYMPIPKSASNTNRLKMISGMIRPSGGGDRTNISKFYEDLLQGIVIKNDNKIQSGNVSKYYGEIPRVVINVRKL